MPGSLFNNVADLRHRCFLLLVKFLRTRFFIEHLWWLLLYFHLSSIAVRTSLQLGNASTMTVNTDDSFVQISISIEMERLLNWLKNKDRRKLKLKKISNVKCIQISYRKYLIERACYREFSSRGQCELRLKNYVHYNVSAT